jgi:hypothetical protein
MTSFVSHVTIDAHDAYAQSQWWRQVLGYVDLPDDPNSPGDEECSIVDPDTGRELLFIEVPEAKTLKNHIHLDLRPRDCGRDEEIARVIGLGATVLEDLRGIRGPGTGWVVLADPEGNEFCILRSPAELAAASE